MSSQRELGLRSWVLEVVQDVDVAVEFQWCALALGLLDTDGWDVVGQSGVDDVLEKLLVS